MQDELQHHQSLILAHSGFLQSRFCKLFWPRKVHKLWLKLQEEHIGKQASFNMSSLDFPMRKMFEIIHGIYLFLFLFTVRSEMWGRSKTCRCHWNMKGQIGSKLGKFLLLNFEDSEIVSKRSKKISLPSFDPICPSIV